MTIPLEIEELERFLAKDIFHDMAVDVGEAEVAAGVVVGEAFVIEA